MVKHDFWYELKQEINSRSIVQHPLAQGLYAGTLRRETILEWCAQIKFLVQQGITTMAYVIPAAPMEAKRDITANLFGEIVGTPDRPAHDELVYWVAEGLGYTREDVDALPPMWESWIYPDKLSRLALGGSWLEGLCYIALAAEEMFGEFCDKAARALKSHYGLNDRQVQYFTQHIEDDAEHSGSGWNYARLYATTDEMKERVKRAALEGRAMWWAWHDAIYRKYEDPSYRSEVAAYAYQPA